MLRNTKPTTLRMENQNHQAYIKQVHRIGKTKRELISGVETAKICTGKEL
jgi:hypothetical protein